MLAAIHLMQEGVFKLPARLIQLKNAKENTFLAALENIVKAIQPQLLSTPPTIPSTAITLKASSTQPLQPAVSHVPPPQNSPGHLQGHHQLMLSV